jgi:hypothetical protein
MIIRGQEINLIPFEKEIEYFKSLIWNFRKWLPASTLKDKSGTTVNYIGQKYNPNEWDLNETGWSHDHCEICTLILHESEDALEQFGYTDDNGHWLCYECFRKIISEDYDSTEFVYKLSVKLSNGQTYLLVSPMNSDLQFEISTNARFGGVKVMKYLDVPRKLLKTGEQDYNTYAILLSDPKEIVNLQVEQVYKLTNE